MRTWSREALRCVAWGGEGSNCALEPGEADLIAVFAVSADAGEMDRGNVLDFELVRGAGTKCESPRADEEA